MADGTRGKGGRLSHPVAESIRRRVAKVFARLDEKTFIKPEELAEFRWYEELFASLLAAIDAKLAAGRIRPLDFKGFPQVVSFPGYSINAGFYIGSFDPFQMTHLAMALKMLASDSTDIDTVFVVPEGHANPAKPRKSEYRYRYDVLRMQVRDEFHPLIVPLDVGEGADTIEIVRRFLATVPGATVNATHLVGSDVLPTVARLLPVDLEAWRAEAERSRVRFSYRALVVRRDEGADLEPFMEAIRSHGVKADLDGARIASPSSTDFRERHHFTILFPTDAVLSHVEVLFRYGMSKPWSSADGPPPGGK